MEYWKFVYGYPHLIVSNRGKVRSLLYAHVHRLVAEAFVPNPNGYDTVDHIDGNKLNNNADNLQWLSRGDNIRKAGDARWKGAKPVICIETGKIYKSVTQASNELNIPQATISAIAKGEYKSYHKLHFKYYNNN